MDNRNNRDKKQINILDKFQIQTGDIKDYCIIGIDPGAGEWSASVVKLLGNTMAEVKDLYVLNDGRTCKDCSVLYYSKEADNWIIGKRAANVMVNEGSKGDFFENFKVLPDSEYAKECYEHDFENPTMEELMVQNFQCIVERLFAEGNNNLEKGKYIFFVGRPASAGWEEAELAYRDLLYDALQIQGVEKENIQIAMVSEAQASLAAEIYGRKGLDLKSGCCQVVIDVGSSTVDAIVIRGGELTGEYSRQIGAGCIEENMLEVFLYDDCGTAGVEKNRLEEFFSEDSEYKKVVTDRQQLRNRLRKAAYVDGTGSFHFKFSNIGKFNSILVDPSALIRFSLRTGKEDYFGPDGNNGIKSKGQWFEMNGAPEGGAFLPINKKTMDKAIYRMPVFVPCTEYDEKDNPYKRSYIYRSYYDALAHFMDGVKEIFLAGESAPDVILTGGASVMPFVKQLIREKLGAEPVNSVQPSYTVSRGLAYIGYAEIKKREELTAINQIINKVMEENKWELSYNIRTAFSEWYIEERLKTLKGWKENGYGTSLDKALDTTYYYDSKKLGEMDIVKEWWNNKVRSVIVKEIRERFETLYKNADVRYDFVINPRIVENAYKEGKTTQVNYRWADVFGGWTAFWFDPDKTDYTSDKRAKFYGKALEHRTGMEEDVRQQQSVIDLSNEHAGEILTGFKKELYKDVVTYVEGLTPYIVRSSQ